jgi:ParB-like chromosome segregation protein Spo0J
MSSVPVIVLGHLSEPQRRALVIADNQLALNAAWDEELLRQELSALQGDHFDLALTGFDDTELSRLLAAEDPGVGLTDEDTVPRVLSADGIIRAQLPQFQSAANRPGDSPPDLDQSAQCSLGVGTPGVKQNSVTKFAAARKSAREWNWPDIRTPAQLP